jgi:cation channel sperm-associated protein 3
MVGTLRHEDAVPMSHLACDPTWLETFLITMRYHEYSMYRIQQAHHAIAASLSEYGMSVFTKCVL